MTTGQIIIVSVFALLCVVAIGSTAIIREAMRDKPLRVLVPRPESRVQVTKLDGQTLRGQVVVTDDDTLILEQVDIIDADGATTTATGGRWLLPRNRIEAIQEL